ncbi:MAG TPA: HAD-IA family hydrolase, partial [Thermoanaerobaculia bacterium]|nr:HAD-IA family hydrolase [Thermoanaerobaculia bacterium]
HALFFGEGGDGLIARELWLPRPGWLEGLAVRHRLALFTGRSRPELAVTLRRAGCEALFDPVVTSDDVVRGKPAPDGLLAILGATGEGARLLFVGDTVDDAASARAAGVPFVGVVAPGSASPEASRRALAGAGALAVLADVHEVEAVAGELWR